ncbi:MAG: G8 domain-containing protein [Flavobacterium sp.]
MEQLNTNLGVSSTEMISTQANVFKSKMQFNRWLSMGCILFLVLFTGALHAQTGRSCATPDVISFLPYSGSGFDTAGFNNVTSSPCNSNYIGGDDYVFTYTATSTNQIQITTSGTGTWVGIHVTNGCPNDVATTCIAFAGSSSANPQLVTPNLQIGVTYFLTISTWPSPQSTAFNINVIELIPTSRQTAQSGNWSDPNTWVGGQVPTIVDFVTINTGHSVVIDQANISCQTLTIDGTLNYATTPTSFSVNGDLTVNAGGLFNVFQGTTGKQLIARGNITNNGSIDLSFGSTTATTGNLNLAGSSVQTVSGSGVWGGTVSSTTTTNTINVINSLTFNNTSLATPNIIWNFDGVRIKSVLNTTSARVDLNGNKIYLSNFGSSLGTITMPIGTGFMDGTFARWWTTTQTGTAITAGTDPTNATSRYPFISATGLNRAFYVNRSSSTAGSNVAGYLVVTYNDVPGITTGLSIADGAYTITDRVNSNWSVSTENGYNYVSGTHRVVAFLSEGIFVTSNTSARLMNLNGVVGNFQTGSVTPAAQRIDISTAQLIAEPFYIGTNSDDIPFLSITNGDWNNPTTWNKNVIPTCDDFVTIVNGNTVTVNSVSNVAKGVTVATGGTLSVSSGELIVGCTLNNNTFTNNGELNVSSGILNVNGNMIHNSGSVFNQSGGQIIVDGNNAGDAATSVASGVSIVQLNSQFINWTGGELVIVDPHANTTASNTFTYTNSIEHVNVPNTHTLKLGDGVSTDAGGNATNGFRINTFPGSRRIKLGNLVVNTLGGTNRHVTTAFALGFSGNLEIYPSSEVTFATSYVAGNVINNGVFNSTTGFFLSNFLNGTVSASVNTQSISGSGLFRNNATTPTASFASLTVNNTNATGVTLNVPISVSGTLTMTSGIINTTDTNLLTLGTATAAGTLSGTPSETNMINGPFARTFAASRSSSALGTATLFPVGVVGAAPALMSVDVNPVTNASGSVIFTVQAFNTMNGSAGVGVSNLASVHWSAIPNNSANLTSAQVRLNRSDASITASSKLLYASLSTGDFNGIVGASSSTVGSNVFSTGQILTADYKNFFSYGDLTPCTVPADQATDLIFPVKTTTTLTASYTAAASNPTGYLVVRTASGVPATDPVDFTNYTAGAAALGGTIAYVGSALTFNQTGLTANTTYDYTIFTFNNSGCAGPVYNTIAPTTASITTCATVTGTPGTPTLSNNAPTSFTASWTASSTAGVDYIIDVATNSGFTVFVPGYQGLNVGNALTINITNLTAATSYWVRVRADLSGCSSVNSSVLAVATICNTVVPFLSEGFEDNSNGLDCWRFGLVSGTNNWAIQTGASTDISAAYAGTRFAVKPYDTSNALIYSLPLNYTSVTNLTRLNVYLHRHASAHVNDEYRIYVNTSASLTGATQILSLFSRTTTAPTVPSTGWYNYLIDIPSSFHGQPIVYIIFQGITTAGFSSYDLGVDNFMIETAPTVWNGTAWSNGVPNSTINAVIMENFVTSADINSKDLTINSGRTLTVASGHKLKINGNFINNGQIIFKSDVNGSGVFEAFTGAISGTGNAVVERYLPAKRAWRFLTSPVTGSSNNSVFFNWQNNGSTVNNGTGVDLWSPSGGNGLVAGGSAPNIYKYQTTFPASWIPVSNTTTEPLFTSSTNNAFMVFVTGAANANNIASGSSATTLIASGALRTGNINYGNLPSDVHTLIGNPYASPLNPFEVLDNNPGFRDKLWVLDPEVGTVGQYVIYDKALGYSNTSGSYSAGTRIQSGQAFFVRRATTAPLATFTITETQKATEVDNGVFDKNATQSTPMFDKLRLSLWKSQNDQAQNLDAVLAAFYANGNNAVDMADGGKINGVGENLALMNGTSALTIEHRATAIPQDVLPVRVSGMQEGSNYQLRLQTDGFNNPNVEVFLHDTFTNTFTLVPTDDTVVTYPFTVTSSASSTGNRFQVVFQNTPLSSETPGTLNQAVAYPNPVNNGVLNISLPFGTYERVSLFNTLGQTIYQQRLALSTNLVTVPTHELANGYYQLQVVDQQGKVYQVKVLINQ